MAAFEYRYRFSVDEEINRRYDFNWCGVRCFFETRIHFIVEGISGERIPIDWESYAVSDWLKRHSEGYVLLHIGRRLSDCWMPNRQIRTMVQQFIGFANQIRHTGRRGIIPAAVDVEVCTVQRQGEAMAAAVERAMKPEFLPPLYLYPVDKVGHPATSKCLPDFSISYLKAMAPIRVEDVEKALCVMDLCVLCGRKPFVGTQILKLLCGHAFHYHCIAPRLLEETDACPTCNHQPAFDKLSSFDTLYKYDNPGYISSEDEDDHVCQCHGPSLAAVATAVGETFWTPSLDHDNHGQSHRPTTAAEAFWSRLLDNDDDDDPDYDPADDDDDDSDYDPAADDDDESDLDCDDDVDESDLDCDPAPADHDSD